MPIPLVFPSLHSSNPKAGLPTPSNGSKLDLHTYEAVGCPRRAAQRDGPPRIRRGGSTEARRLCVCERLPRPVFDPQPAATAFQRCRADIQRSRSIFQVQVEVGLQQGQLSQKPSFAESASKVTAQVLSHQTCASSRPGNKLRMAPTDAEHHAITDIVRAELTLYRWKSYFILQKAVGSPALCKASVTLLRPPTYLGYLDSIHDFRHRQGLLLNPRPDITFMSCIISHLCHGCARRWQIPANVGRTIGQHPGPSAHCQASLPATLQR
jgi:hypothetical protein